MVLIYNCSYNKAVSLNGDTLMFGLATFPSRVQSTCLDLLSHLQKYMSWSRDGSGGGILSKNELPTGLILANTFHYVHEQIPYNIRKTDVLCHTTATCNFNITFKYVNTCILYGHISTINYGKTVVICGFKVTSVD